MTRGVLPLRPWKKVVLYGAPLLLALVDLRHPTDFTADVYHGLQPLAETWILVHLAHLILVPLLALSIWFLMEGCHGWMAAASRLGAGVFAVFYTATDAVSGLAVGTLVNDARGLPYTQQETVARAVQKLFFDPVVGGGFSAVGIVGAAGWLVAALAAAECLHKAHAPFLAVSLVIVSAVLFGISHAPPLGPLGLVCYLLGLLIAGWADRGEETRV